MESTRNRSIVLAKFLRAATHDLRRARRRVDAAADEIRDNALQSIDAVADELEQLQRAPAAPDPAGGSL